MAVNPWGTEGNAQGSVWGDASVTGPYVTTSQGDMDARAVQNSGLGVNTDQEQFMAARDAAQLVQAVYAGQMSRQQAETALAGKYGTLTSNFISSAIDKEMVAQDNNPFDGVGNDPNASRSMVSNGGQNQGFFSGMMSGLMGVGAAIGGALGSAKDSVVALGQRLLNSGVEMEPRDISLAELGNLTPNLQVGKARSIDGPQVG